MQYRKFGKTGWNVSEVGVGCWQIGGADWGDISESVSLNILHSAADMGINFFDTADVYGLGRSETVLGKFLKETHKDVYVATKLGRFPEPGWPENFNAASIRKHTEASLTRLGIDMLDITQLHCIPTDEYRKGDVFETLSALKSEGKIAQFGVSVESMEEALLCMEHTEVASLQIIFNIFRQKPIDVLFEKAKEKGVALIIRLPVASGLLSGRYSRNTTFPAQDHRNYNRDGQAFNVGETFAGLPFDIGVDLAEKVRGYLPEGMTMAQMAERWCLDFDAVSVIIPGVRSVDQLKGNADVSNLSPLSPEIHKGLRELYRNEVQEHIRGPY